MSKIKFKNTEPFHMNGDDLQKFIRTMYVDQTTGCWIATTAQDRDGYTQFYLTEGVTARRHRVAYEHFRGELATDILDHIICDNPTCCNPWHLEVSDLRKNTLRSCKAVAAINARKIVCSKGHPFDLTYDRLDKDGKVRTRRICSICKRQWHIDNPKKKRENHGE